jgi:hypothetical protein
MRRAEEARDGIAGIDGMAGPWFEVKHPNNSNSYVDFDRFCVSCASMTMALGQKWPIGEIGTAGTTAVIVI